MLALGEYPTEKYIAGWEKSSMGWHFGFKLHLMIDKKALIKTLNNQLKNIFRNVNIQDTVVFGISQLI